jgi:hypothetical protein
MSEVTTETLNADFQANKPFNTAGASDALQKKLVNFEKSILEKSQSFVDQLTSWNDQMNNMVADIEDISGSFAKIKGDAGMKIIAPELIAGKKPTLDPSKENATAEHKIEFPDYPFDINLTTYDQVGHQVSDLTGDNTTNTALITTIPPGSPLPELWTRYQDYFVPEISTQLSAADEDFETSFSLYYGFNPVPIAIEDTKKAMREAGMPIPTRRKLSV